MTTRFDTPREAEVAFYRAFEDRDLEAMMAVWDESDDVVCVHPMGSPLRGPRAVAEAWREILAAEASLRFGIEEIQITHQGPLAIHIVKEHILVAAGKPVAPMTATNIYRQTPSGWRMILHHASPAPPALPARPGAAAIH